jgi:acyl dehydratase
MSAAEPDTDEVREQVERFVGRRLGPYLSYNAVSRVQVWQWCSALGDRNPLYLPEGGAPAVAPPAMMQAWTMRDSHFRYAPGSATEEPFEVLKVLEELGFGGNVAVSYDINFHRYIGEGDRVHSYSTIVSITQRKKTALGEGYFVVERAEYLDQTDTPFAEATISYFAYRPAEPGDGEVPAPPAGQAAPAASEEGQLNCNTGAVPAWAGGDQLPPLPIPISATLIVAGAVASQDFTEVHHDHAAALEAGMPDIFMNILTTCGLCARYLTDWAGPEARLEALNFRLFAPNTPGEVMRFTGEVLETAAADGTGRATVEFQGANSLGLHVAGRATLRAAD